MRIRLSIKKSGGRPFSYQQAWKMGISGDGAEILDVTEA